MLDAHGQPVMRQWNKKYRCDRTIDELLGIAKGIIADGIVNEEEIKFLQGWLQKNNDLSDKWPINVINNRIARIFEDGVVDKKEKKEMFEVLQHLTGQLQQADVVENMSTSLPFTNPSPDIVFEKHPFCFTGKFLFGTRNDCYELTQQLGGSLNERPYIGYLVIGEIGSRDWAHTSFGRKIEYAIQNQNKWGPDEFKRIGPWIIPEQQWVTSAMNELSLKL